MPNSGMCVLWGARDGSVGALHFHEGEISPLWTWQPAAHRQGGSVTSLVAGLLSEDMASPVVAVGRSDGAVLVLGAAETGMDLVFSGDLEESVRGLVLGAVSSSAHTELAAVVFSGKVVSFTTERMSAPDKTDQYGRSRATVHAESRVRMLSQEVDELKKRLAKGEEALEKLRVLSKSPKSSPVKSSRAAATEAAASTEPIASAGISKSIAAAFTSGESKPYEEAQVMVGLPEVPMEVSASLVAEAAAYAIAVELPLPIDTVLLTTSSPIDVLDVAAVSPHVLTESMDPLAGLSPGARSALSMDSATVQSIMPPDATGRMHAVFRCQDETKRWSCAVRVVEGRSTAIQLLITACSVPKVVRVATLSIKPLGLHMRLPSPAPMPASSHALAATGDFSASHAMEWIANVLPDMPARVNEVHTPSVALLPETGLSPQLSERLMLLGDAGPTRRIFYKSSILGSLLVLSWRDGCVVAQGQSASALAILKESLLRSATDAAVRADVQWVHSSSASEALLQSLQPMIQQAAATAERAELVDVLREVTWEDGAGDAAPEWLLPELADVLKNATGYQLAAKRQPQLLKILRGVILDLFIDDAKLQGKDSRGALPELQAALEANQVPRIIEMFRQHLQTTGTGE